MSLNAKATPLGRTRSGVGIAVSPCGDLTSQNKPSFSQSKTACPSVALLVRSCHHYVLISSSSFSWPSCNVRAYHSVLTGETSVINKHHHPPQRKQRRSLTRRFETRRTKGRAPSFSETSKFSRVTQKFGTDSSAPSLGAETQARCREKHGTITSDY